MPHGAEVSLRWVAFTESPKNKENDKVLLRVNLRTRINEQAFYNKLKRQITCEIEHFAETGLRKPCVVDRAFSQYQYERMEGTLFGAMPL